MLATIANDGILWILLFAAIVTGYFLPTFIGLIRGVDQIALVFLINLIATPLLIGWPAAMILACGPRRAPRPPWAHEVTSHPEHAYGSFGLPAYVFEVFPAVPPQAYLLRRLSIRERAHDSRPVLHPDTKQPERAPRLEASSHASN